MDLLVLAKEPVAGRVKTRLVPPCTPEEAAEVAAASLADTLAAAVASGADRVVLGLEGRPGAWCPPGIAVVDQGTGALADRLETLWAQARGPALQVGMDTPQITADLLRTAMDRLATPDADGEVDALIGLAEDGGWWALGLRDALPGCFGGIATSRADTGARQRARLGDLGRRVGLLPTLRDVDRWADALAVAALAPTTRFARAVDGVQARRTTSACPAVLPHRRQDA